MDAQDTDLKSGALAPNGTGAAPDNAAPDNAAAKMSYQDMFLRMGGREPMDAAKMSQQQRKERRSRVFAAIGDGLTALGNILYSHAPASVPTKTLTEQNKERWDKLRAEQAANNDGYMRAVALDRAEALKDVQWAHQLEKDAKDEERKQAKAKMDAEIHEWNVKEATGKASKAEAEAARAKIIAENEELNQKIAREKARAETHRAYSQADQAKAAASELERKLANYTFLGIKYGSEREREDAIRNAARKLGIDQKQWVNEETTETNPRGKTKKTVKRVQKDKELEDLASEVISKLESIDSTMPGVGGGNGGNSDTMPGVAK